MITQSSYRVVSRNPLVRKSIAAAALSIGQTHIHTQTHRQTQGRTHRQTVRHTQTESKKSKRVNVNQNLG